MSVPIIIDDREINLDPVAKTELLPEREVKFYLTFMANADPDLGGINKDQFMLVARQIGFSKITVEFKTWGFYELDPCLNCTPTAVLYSTASDSLDYIVVATIQIGFKNKYLFQKCKKNENGVVTWKDFITKVRKVLRQRHYGIEEVRNAFQKCDKDSDGFITVDDLSKATKEIEGHSIAEDQLQLWIDHVDKNKDGKVDYSEFMLIFGF